MLRNVYTSLPCSRIRIAGGKSLISIPDLQSEPTSMYTRTLRKAAHTRRFSISNNSPSGWEVRDEEDSHLIRRRLYQDWHRVERARSAFAREAAGLRDAGWDELN